VCAFLCDSYANKQLHMQVVGCADLWPPSVAHMVIPLVIVQPLKSLLCDYWCTDGRI
jgi:hypothetical protein